MITWQRKSLKSPPPHSMQMWQYWSEELHWSSHHPQCRAANSTTTMRKLDLQTLYLNEFITTQVRARPCHECGGYISLFGCKQQYPVIKNGLLYMNCNPSFHDINRYEYGLCCHVSVITSSFCQFSPPTSHLNFLSPYQENSIWLGLY